MQYTVVMFDEITLKLVTGRFALKSSILSHKRPSFHAPINCSLCLMFTHPSYRRALLRSMSLQARLKFCPAILGSVPDWLCMTPLPSQWTALFSDVTLWLSLQRKTHMQIASSVCIFDDLRKVMSASPPFPRRCLAPRLVQRATPSNEDTR